MSSNRRTYRVAEKLQQLIAQEVLRLSDPRFMLVTITSVVVSPDLRNAKVYWIVTGGKERQSEVEEAFKSAGGYFKRAVAKELRTRVAPEMSFFYDNTLDTVEEIEKLFKRLKES